MTASREIGKEDKTKELTDRERNILNAFKAMPEASQSIIAAEIGWDINTVKYYVKKLKGMGILDRIGSSRKGKWIVKS